MRTAAEESCPQDYKFSSTSRILDRAREDVVSWHQTTRMILMILLILHSFSRDEVACGSLTIPPIQELILFKKLVVGFCSVCVAWACFRDVVAWWLVTIFLIMLHVEVVYTLNCSFKCCTSHEAMHPAHQQSHFGFFCVRPSRWEGRLGHRHVVGLMCDKVTHFVRWILQLWIYVCPYRWQRFRFTPSCRLSCWEWVCSLLLVGVKNQTFRWWSAPFAFMLALGSFSFIRLLSARSQVIDQISIHQC